MALWKPFRGKREDLDAVEKHDGWIYFCVDDASLFFDYLDAEGNLQRKQINAKNAESFGSHSVDEFLLKSDATREAIAYVVNGVLTITQTQTYTTSITNKTFVLGREGKLTTSVTNGVATTTQKGDDYFVSITNNELVVV